MEGLKFIITGTGRCGTLYMANLFTSMGFPCSHEAVFTPKGIDWAKEVLSGKQPRTSSKISEGKRCIPFGKNVDFVAESSYLAAPFIGEFDAKVIHVVRHPTKVVASLVGDGFRNFVNKLPTDQIDFPDHLEYEKFMYQNMPELSGDMTQLDRGCLFYVGWNEMIERSGKVELFHRVEDDVEDIKKLLGFVGESYYDNRKCNTVKERRKWSISEIADSGIRKRFEDIAERYGYKIPINS